MPGFGQFQAVAPNCFPRAALNAWEGALRRCCLKCHGEARRPISRVAVRVKEGAFLEAFQVGYIAVYHLHLQSSLADVRNNAFEGITVGVQAEIETHNFLANCQSFDSS